MVRFLAIIKSVKGVRSISYIYLAISCVRMKESQAREPVEVVKIGIEVAKQESLP